MLLHGIMLLLLPLLLPRHHHLATPPAMATTLLLLSLPLLLEAPGTRRSLMAMCQGPGGCMGMLGKGSCARSLQRCCMRWWIAVKAGPSTTTR